jgi:hypothetical protein
MRKAHLPRQRDQFFTGSLLFDPVKRDLLETVGESTGSRYVSLWLVP